MTNIKNHRIDGAAYVSSPNKSGKITPLFIVQHYTAGYTASSAINTLTRKGSGVSAHVTVDLDGTITQHVPFNVKAWHAGPSRHMGYKGLNNYSIGIEIVNIGWLRQLGNGQFQDAYGNTRTEADFPHGLVFAASPRAGSGTFAWPRYTPEQLAAVDSLTEALCDKYSIIDIVSHEEIDTRGWKTDPGPAFPMQLLKRHLASDRGDDSERYEVTASSLRVRSGPGAQFDTLRNINRGTSVEVIDRNGEWAQIDEDGWVHSGYLRRT
jgi:N-acetylmuramoyl-L-alanine amidase